MLDEKFSKLTIPIKSFLHSKIVKSPWKNFPKKSVLGEDYLAKEFDFFPGKFNSGCFELVEMC